jgi:hypothetical protein
MLFDSFFAAGITCTLLLMAYKVRARARPKTLFVGMPRHIQGVTHIVLPQLWTYSYFTYTRPTAPCKRVKGILCKGYACTGSIIFLANITWLVMPVMWPSDTVSRSCGNLVVVVRLLAPLLQRRSCLSRCHIHHGKALEALHKLLAQSLCGPPCST